MIQNSFVLLLFLAAIETGVLALDKNPKTRFLFKFLPSIFWIYFLPMLAATTGILDNEHPLYNPMIRLLLPASLILVLIPADLPAILRLGKSALIMMAAGTAGIMIATSVAAIIFKPWLPVEAWSGLGVLSASWIGGSANMVAVKESIGTPENIFAPMILVDTLVGYTWMGLLIALSSHQEKLDQWNHSDRKTLDLLSHQMADYKNLSTSGLRFGPAILLIAGAVLGSYGISKLSLFLPEIENAISKFAWTVLMASTLGIALSLTPLRKLESHGVSRVGNFLLYLVLTAIGAQANLTKIQDAFIFIVLGCFIVAVHGLILASIGRLIKAPVFLLAAASQANIGGLVSAPIVAAVYQPGLAAVGLLLAVLGNIAGTYLGWITSQVCRVILQGF